MIVSVHLICGVCHILSCLEFTGVSELNMQYGFFEKLQTEIYISEYYCRKNILLQCRNKSKPQLDGTEDTARASVLPTAVG